ncbi:MAG: hypothetical protein IKB60_00640, partial [Clostridia bacterium]|nr:hypothetical protein [Clostridia bacterium]
MFKKSISLVLSIIMLMAMCAFAPVSYAEGDVLTKLGLVGTNNIVSFDEDFSDYEAGTYTPATGGITPTQLVGTGSFEITESGELKATTTGGGERKITMRYNFPTAVNTGLLTASMTINKNETSITEDISSWTFFVLYTNDTTLQSSVTKKKADNIVDKSGAALSPQPQTVDGKYHLLYTARRETAGEEWAVEIYDTAGTEPVLVYSGVMPSSFGNINFIDLARSYSTGTTTTAIDDISVKTYASYEV